MKDTDSLVIEGFSRGCDEGIKRVPIIKSKEAIYGDHFYFDGYIKVCDGVFFNFKKVDGKKRPLFAGYLSNIPLPNEDEFEARKNILSGSSIRIAFDDELDLLKSIFQINKE